MSSNSIWIMQAPVISTAHISLEFSKKLADWMYERAPWGQEILDLEGGWMFFVGANEADNVPDELQHLFTWAASGGYEWLRLDEDGDVIPNMPVYEW